MDTTLHFEDFREIAKTNHEDFRENGQINFEENGIFGIFAEEIHRCSQIWEGYSEERSMTRSGLGKSARMDVPHCWFKERDESGNLR